MYISIYIFHTSSSCTLPCVLVLIDAHAQVPHAPRLLSPHLPMIIHFSMSAQLYISLIIFHNHNPTLQACAGWQHATRNTQHAARSTQHAAPAVKYYKHHNTTNEHHQSSSISTQHHILSTTLRSTPTSHHNLITHKERERRGMKQWTEEK